MIDLPLTYNGDIHVQRNMWATTTPGALKNSLFRKVVSGLRYMYIWLGLGKWFLWGSTKESLSLTSPNTSLFTSKRPLWGLLKVIKLCRGRPWGFWWLICMQEIEMCIRNWRSTHPQEGVELCQIPQGKWSILGQTLCVVASQLASLHLSLSLLAHKQWVGLWIFHVGGSSFTLLIEHETPTSRWKTPGCTYIRWDLQINTSGQRPPSEH